MTDPAASGSPGGDTPPDLAAARAVARVRLMMLVSAATTFVAIAAVLGVIGYRVFRASESTAPGTTTALIPKSARIVATTIAADRLVLTLDVGGATEIRTYDLDTFKPLGHLRFAPEP